MTTLLVINPFSRGGDSDCQDIKDILSKLGPLEAHSLDKETTVGERIEQIGPALQRIVVAGGDGTLNQVLPTVLDAGVPVGVLPMGTANDFARSLNLPDQPCAAARTIAEGFTRQVDVGVVNGQYFLNAVGIGLGPDLTKEMDREKKKRLGVLAYLESLIHVIGRHRRRFAWITVDGETFSSRFMQITVANGRHYGGGMMVSDDVQMDDGLLHVLCVRPLHPLQLLLRGLRIKFGAVSDDEKLEYRKGKKIEIRTRRPCDVTADGELVTTTPIQCHTEPRVLAVFAPPEEAKATEADIPDGNYRNSAACA